MIISLVKPYEDIQRDVNILINGRKTNISEDENIKLNIYYKNSMLNQK